ncbi:hypothetical protein AXG93_4541s1010 [Marchantia polymorpha subsp. ruderalis]|uniref:Uncharacterized protein n=1 Tax=Marchantia polymorpha subsp. ruderalis TaxID=1480154 RepID=A0A176VT61_MARPO|nr:hypothetical protein AXG93_4541s1010 [Marchantia polymorpha subsp. ruderalis]
MKRQATRKEKGKAIMIEEGTPKKNLDPSAEARVASPRTSTGTVILETGEDSSAEEIQSEGVNTADVLCGQVIPLLGYLNSKLGKYVRTINVGSYVELVRNKTRVKMATAHAVVDKERLEASRVAFNEESRRVDELTADLKKKYQMHAPEMAMEVKALAECEAARTSDLELIDRLEAKCNEMRSQRSLVEEQLSEMEVKLSEAKEKNQKLAE